MRPLYLFDDNIAIDIDDCVENGKLSAMAAEIVDSLGSYAELSISGTGVHIWAGAPGLIYDKERYYFNNRTYGLEIYPAGVISRNTFQNDFQRSLAEQKKISSLMEREKVSLWVF